MNIQRLPIIDKDLKKAEDIYFETIQMIDEWDIFQSKVEEFYHNNMRYNSILSENPSDCWESTLTDTQVAMCEEILNPTTEFFELLKAETIEEIYDNEDYEILAKVQLIIKNTLEEHYKMARYYICAIF